MKILWITNMVMPELADYLGVQTSSSGTWMIDISQKLSQLKDCRLAVASVYGDSFRRIDVGNTTYYLLPGNGKNMLFYTKKFENMWQAVNDEFQPDIVHIHGTEYSHGLAFLRACPDIRAVVSVQGILNRIKDVDFGEIPLRHFIINRTLNQNLHFNGEIEMHLLNKKNAKYEAEMLRRVQYINTVNTWDRTTCMAINPNLKAFNLEYNLREEMYTSPKWQYETMEPYTIFTNPGGYPLKGLHKLIEAAALLKNKYPDIKIRVPGMGKDGKLVLDSAYSKYIFKLLNRYGLMRNFEFLGRQTGTQMCKNMLKAHAVVVPSAIEGASLILREAMFLGCPVVAAFRGGMADFISDKVDGFLYDFQEAPYLAERLSQIFESRDLCEAFSASAIKKAEIAHDREKNVNDYLNMYEEIIRGK